MSVNKLYTFDVGRGIKIRDRFGSKSLNILVFFPRTTITTQGPFKWFQHLIKIRSTKVDRMLDERSVQTVSRKKNFESMLNESLNQFEFDSTHFQVWNIFFTLSTMLNDLFKRPRHLVQQGVERMLK